MAYNTCKRRITPVKCALSLHSAGMWFDDLWWDLRVSRNIIISQSGKCITLQNGVKHL